MKYNARDPLTGAVDLRLYEKYLERDRAEFAARIHGADLLSIDRFFPKGPQCFHDARFDRFSLTAHGTERPGSHAQTLRAELRLRGPFFDRDFELHYDDVTSCTFQAPEPDDDLLTHEVRPEDGLVVHELAFDHGRTIAITCREMRFVEIR
ncbi:MAG TPA: hypothetical protein VIF57_26110 [Polyangia bacterium]|jgi:hypothetical protein